MSPQLRNSETPAERNVRIATEQGAIHAEAVLRLLQPSDEQTAAGPMPFATIGGETIPLASAVARLRKDNPALAGLFNAGGNLDLRGIDAPTVPRNQGNQRADTARPGAEAVTPSCLASPRFPDRGGRGRRFQSV